VPFSLWCRKCNGTGENKLIRGKFHKITSIEAIGTQTTTFRVLFLFVMHKITNFGLQVADATNTGRAG
jgi:hypothetical protein